MRWAASVGILAFACCALIGLAFLEQSFKTNHFQSRPDVLYTAPHAEFAPFQRVWNPDTNNDYTVGDFDQDPPDDGNGEIVQDDLCGADGTNCPELPAFSGEDYFDSNPIGCCYNKEQQQVWSNWMALKNRVAKLEGVVQSLQKRKSSVTITWKMDPKIEGKPGPPGPSGTDGLQGPQGAKWINCEIGYYNTAAGTCVSCTNKPENSVYTSNANYYSPNTCAWGCVTGFYKSGNSCTSCSTQQCDSGMYRGACQADSDGVCEACNSIGSNAQFTGPGTPYNVDNCEWACRSGYWRNGNGCSQCSTASCSIGYYRSACSNTVDGTCASCTNDLPANAVYTSSGIPYNTNNCQWTCKTDFFKDGDKCTACSQSSCKPGFYRSSCSSSADGVCTQCTNNLPWHASYTGAGNPYNLNNCEWTCDSSFYKKGDSCYACSQTTCPTGNYRGECTTTSDATCIPCTNTVAANYEYSGGGKPYNSNNCPTKCKDGFFLLGLNKEQCIPALRVSLSTGGIWSKSWSSVRLFSGDAMSIDIYQGGDVYNSQQGRVALFVDQNSATAIRHRNGYIWTESFVSNNYDFAWKLYKSGNGIEFYNDFDGGQFIVKDRFDDQLTIVPWNDPRRIVWTLDTFPSGTAWWNNVVTTLPSSLANPWVPQFWLRNPNKNNLCMDNCGGQSSPGSCKIRLVTCDKTSQYQQFSYDPSTNLIKSVNQPQLCLDDGGSWGSGTTIMTWYTCDVNNNNQIFYYNTKTQQLFNPRKNNLCLDDGGTQRPSSAQMYLYNCDPNNNNQKFVTT